METSIFPLSFSGNERTFTFRIHNEGPFPETSDPVLSFLVLKDLYLHVVLSRSVHEIITRMNFTWASVILKNAVILMANRTIRY